MLGRLHRHQTLGAGPRLPGTVPTAAEVLDGEPDLRGVRPPADDALPNGGVTADFSAETWWLTLIKAGFIVAFLIVSVMMALWVERRGLARMQTRLGPNVNGPWACSRLSLTPASSS